MKDEFWSCNLFELQKYKNANYEDLIEMSHSFMNYVKEIFPVNEVPENIANSVKHLEERLKLTREQYELTVERVCLEIQTMIEKGELK